MGKLVKCLEPEKAELAEEQGQQAGAEQSGVRHAADVGGSRDGRTLPALSTCTLKHVGLFTLHAGRCQCCFALHMAACPSHSPPVGSTPMTFTCGLSALM